LENIRLYLNKKVAEGHGPEQTKEKQDYGLVHKVNQERVPSKQAEKLCGKGF